MRAHRVPVTTEGESMQSCTVALRRHAAIGAAVAIVAASSAFGIGATAASAATTDTPPSAVPSPTDAVHPGGATPLPAPAPAAGTVTPAPDPSPTETVTPAPAAAPAPAPTPSPTTETITTTDVPAASPTATPAAAPVAWAEPSTRDEPIVLTTTAGELFAHTFTATGGDGPLEYRFDPLTEATGWSWDEQTGVLRGTATSTLASSTLFEVTATDQQHTAVQYVQVVVEPGAPVGVTFGVTGGTRRSAGRSTPTGRSGSGRPAARRTRSCPPSRSRRVRR